MELLILLAVVYVALVLRFNHNTFGSMWELCTIVHNELDKMQTGHIPEEPEDMKLWLKYLTDNSDLEWHSYLFIWPTLLMVKIKSHYDIRYMKRIIERS